MFKWIGIDLEFKRLTHTGSDKVLVGFGFNGLSKTQQSILSKSSSGSQTINLWLAKLLVFGLDRVKKRSASGIS